MAVALLAGERHDKESEKAVQACNDYLRMGPGRSLRRLSDVYIQQASSDAQAAKPPTTKPNTLFTWSTDYDWQKRAENYDAEQDRAKTAEMEARRRAVMEEGLALDFERVIELKELAALLGEQIYTKASDGTYPNIWLRDVKQIGSGEFAERVDLVRFNAPLIEQYRGTLDDLAKETGGRKQRVDLSGQVAMAPFMADEYAQARAELQEWKASLRSKSE
jgi:hypothetical protein